eukprot:scaffold92534_cov69-Phaeocystis_antarctica.AAC.4
MPSSNCTCVAALFVADRPTFASMRDQMSLSEAFSSRRSASTSTDLAESRSALEKRPVGPPNERSRACGSSPFGSSTSKALRPKKAACCAAAQPTGPPPITITSYVVVFCASVSTPYGSARGTASFAVAERWMGSCFFATAGETSAEAFLLALAPILSDLGATHTTARTAHVSWGRDSSTGHFGWT